MRAPQHIAADLQLCDNSPLSASGSPARAYAAASAENVTAITKYALLRLPGPVLPSKRIGAPRRSLRGPSRKRPRAERPSESVPSSRTCSGYRRHPRLPSGSGTWTAASGSGPRTAP